MGRSQPAGSGVGGGELIPTFSRAGRTRVGLSLSAVAIAIALGVLVATDAGAASGLAWDGTAFSVAILAIGLGLGSSTALQVPVALLGVLLLLRTDDRLVLAPLYGAALLILVELGWMSLELRALKLVDRRAICARLMTIVLFAGLGACAAGAVAIAVTGAPARSVAITAVGTIAVAVAFAGIVLSARRAHWQVRSADTPPERRQPSDEVAPER